MENFTPIDAHHQGYTPIDLHQTRDFSRKLNATFEFVKQNFKPLTKSILYIAGPPMLIASLLIGTLYADFLKTMIGSAATGDPSGFESFLSVSFWSQIVLMMIFLFIGSVSIIATINSYIILYEEKQSNQIAVEEVWARVRSTFMMYMGTIILYSVLLMVASIALAVPIFYASQISPAITVIGFIALFIAFFYVAYGTTFVFFIRGYEKAGFIDSIVRSLYLVRGKWWSTFGLILVLSMLAGTISSIFFIPWYIMFLTTTMHDLTSGTVTEPSMTMQIISTTLLTLYYLSQMILHIFPYIGIAFQYFNLVEMKEARGLMGQIDSIGQADQRPSPANEDF
jgi:hypothetical protein